MNQKPAPEVSVQEMAELGLFECRALEIDCSGVRSGKPFSLDIFLDEQPYTLDLIPKNLRGKNFRVRIQIEDGSYQEVDPPAPMTFHGQVRGKPESEVAASFIDGKLHAMILLSNADSELFFIQPRLQGQGYVEYNNFEVITDDRWNDGHILNPELTEEELNGGDSVPLGPPSGYFYLTEIALDADYEFYGKNNYNLNTTIADMESVMNGVSTVYERDVQITWVINEIIVRTSEPDPYDKITATGILNQFQAQWNNHHTDIIRDVAHLMTGKQIEGSTIGLAWVKAICSSWSGYGIVQSRFTQNYDQRVALSAHEIGH
ncbi:MAG: M12 family metallo-peptidase, partial [Planctomycetota bacterium]